MPTQLTKIALIDTTTLSDTMTFSVVQDGAAESSRQVITIEPNTVMIENDRELIHSKNYNITVAGLFTSSANATKLNTWATNQTPLVFSGFGLDGSILHAEGTIQMNRGFENRLSFRFTSLREAKGGYISSTGKHSAEMSYCTNGLALYEWGDGNSDNLANGWTDAGSIANSFTGTVQTINNGSGNAASLERTIYFPFPNVQLSLFADFTTVTVHTALDLEIEAYDASEQSLSVTLLSTSHADVPGSGGVRVASVNLPASTNYIKVKVNAADDDIASFKEPTLQVTHFASGETLANKQAEYNFVEFNT